MLATYHRECHHFLERAAKKIGAAAEVILCDQNLLLTDRVSPASLSTVRSASTLVPESCTTPSFVASMWWSRPALSPCKVSTAEHSGAKVCIRAATKQTVAIGIGGRIADVLSAGTLQMRTASFSMYLAATQSRDFQVNPQSVAGLSWVSCVCMLLVCCVLMSVVCVYVCACCCIVCVLCVSP